VRDTFDKICQHTKWDLEAIFKANHGGNFAAALIIAASCEALSRLLGKSKDFYLTTILRKGLPPPIAKEIAVALRNGLAHVYETSSSSQGTCTWSSSSAGRPSDIVLCGEIHPESI
jgi:hypothetical protein